jgi:hypothetical protein
MRCTNSTRISDAALVGIAAGTLAPDSYEAELDHLMSCAECQERFDDTARSIDSDASSYVPSPMLVARVLQSSTRMRVRFHMPARFLEPREAADRRSRVAALLGVVVRVSPAALAAATGINVALIAGVGLWFASAAGSLRHVPVVPLSHETVSYLTFVGASTAPSPNPGALLPGDAMRRAAERAVRDSVYRAVNHTLFPLPGGLLAAADSARLTEAAVMLARFPQVRVRMESMPVRAGADAETVARGVTTVRRFLEARGVLSNQLVPETLRRPDACSPRNEQCAGAEARVVLSVLTK